MTPVAHAGTITPNVLGFIFVPAGTYADTVLATGGAYAAPDVFIQLGATLHGDTVLLDAVDVSVAGYRIRNMGVLNSGSGTGIDSDVAVTVVNSGTIGAFFNGIAVNSGSNVSNSNFFYHSTASISGGAAGVIVGTGSQVSNFGDSGIATVIGGTAGVIAGAASTVVNGGDDGSHGTSTIAGGIYGVIAGAGSTVMNDGYTGTARITGGTDGVTVGADSNVYNYYASSIVGTAGNGVAVADNTVLPAVDYGIVNDEGTITGGANGVFAGALARVFNEGIIAGTSNIGVLGGAGSMVHNFSEGISDISSLSGGTDGAVIGKDSWVVNESNYGTAMITGGAAGVIAGAGSTIINFSDNYENPLNSGGGYAASTITGGTAGVITGEGSTVTNFSDHDGVSVITGGATGVIAGAGSTVMNDGYSGTSTITGGIDGMSIGADSDVYNVRGKITGTTGNGITTADNTALPAIGNGIKNLGTIAGGTNGVFAGDFARVYNGGTITGTANIGVHTGANSVVDNYGTITGTVGVSAFGTGGTFNLNNTGGVITGTGGVAIVGLLSGANTFRLSAGPGSVINGDIHGGLGFDTLILNGGRTSAYGATNVVHGDVTSMQDIIKNSTGTAFLGAPGDSLFLIQTDAIHTTGGGLFINGNVGGELVAKTAIHAGGTAFGGTGVWNADINLNAGDFSAGSTSKDLTLSPTTEAMGQVELRGDLNVAAGSFIHFDVDTQAAIHNGVNSDLIVQTGAGNTTTFAPGAGLLFSPLDRNKIITDGTYTVIDSAEPIMGALPSLTVEENHVDYFGPFFHEGAGFDTGTAVMFSEFTTIGLADGGTDLVLTMKHDFERLARTPNQASLGAAIDASVDSDDPLIQDFITAMDHSDLLTVQQTLADLTPETIPGLTDGIVNSGYRLHRQVQGHLAMTRSPGAVMTKTGQTDLWGTASYDWQDFEKEFGTDDFDHEVGSFAAGVDYRVTDKLLLGFVLDGSSSHSDGDGFDTETESLRGAIYATWGDSTGLYVDALAGYGTHHIDSARKLGRMGGILFGEASSSTDAKSLQAMMTVGYAVGDERVKHGPFAGLEYQNLEVDGFTQESILPIAFDDFDIDSLRGLIGYRVDAKLSIFRPYASVAYAHEFGGDRANATAFFGDESFKVSGSKRDSSLLMTAGTGISLMSSLTLDLGYRGDVSMEDEGLSSHGATAGVNWIF